MDALIEKCILQQREAISKQISGYYILIFDLNDFCSRLPRIDYLWLEEMDNSILHSFESDPAEEEDDEHHVGINGGDIDDLGVLGDPLDDA